MADDLYEVPGRGHAPAGDQAVCRPGPPGACYELLCQHEARIQAQVVELQELQASIQKKVAYYAQRMAAGTATGLWRNGPDLTHAE